MALSRRQVCCFKKRPGSQAVMMDVFLNGLFVVRWAQAHAQAFAGADKSRFSQRGIYGAG